MLDFKDPQIEDRQWVTALIESAGRESCEYCFGNVFVWSPVYKTRIVRFEDYFISLSGAEDGMYCFPMGQGDLRKAVDELHRDAVQRGNLLRFFGVTQEDKMLLETLYPDRFLFRENRDFFDYIYAQSDLAALSGKKYHGKRNHIAAFERDGDWTYEEITPDNLPDCIEMDKQWLQKNIAKNEEELRQECQALMRTFDNYAALGFKGALLRKGGEVVAFTIGEEMSSRMFCTHFEKAFADVRGAYPMINREFAARTLREYRYINREEDTGDEGLRKAKLSYHPYKLLKKYEAICKD